MRVSASGHSFTDCALTDGVMIRLDRLTRPLDFDPESGLFKVEGGVVLRDLNRLLDERGVAFENLGDIDRQTVAGSISTGTHGTGERFQNVSAQIAALELVTRRRARWSTVDDSDPDLLRAARVGARRARRHLLGDRADRPGLHASTASTRRSRWPRRSRASTS